MQPWHCGGWQQQASVLAAGSRVVVSGAPATAAAAHAIHIAAVMDTDAQQSPSCSDDKPMVMDSQQVHHEDVSHLVDSTPYSSLSQAPSRMLCASPPALISTAALLPSSPAAQPMGIAICSQQWRNGAVDASASNPATAHVMPLAAAPAVSTGGQTQQPAPAAVPVACAAGAVGAGDCHPAAVPAPTDCSGAVAGMPALPSALGVPAGGTSCDTSKDSSGTPSSAAKPAGSALHACEPGTPATPSGGSRDPLDEVAALHAQFLTPKHLRKGKGGRQPALDPRRDPRVDPARAKRVLANRLSAARSKMKARSQATQVVEARLEQALQQRQSMAGELQSLSSSFRTTTLDNHNLHRHLQALEQHRSQQDALHQQLQAQRDQLLAASNGLPPQHNSAAGAPTAPTASVPQLVPKQPPAHPDSWMPALPSLPSTILTASGGGYPVREAVGALPGALKTAIPTEQQEQPLPWPPSVLPCGTLQQDSLLPHNGVNYSSGQQLLPALPSLLPFPVAEAIGGGGCSGMYLPANGTSGLGDTACPHAAGVSSLDTSGIVPQLLQHGSCVHLKEQEHLATSSASTTVAWSPYQAWE